MRLFNEPAAWLQQQARNPVTVKELRGRMRGRRAFVVLTSYLAAMGTLVTLIYASFAFNSRANPGASLSDAGETIFTTVLVIQAFMALFIAPLFTSGAISGEKERQTYELLRTTLLPAPVLVWGKLLSGLAYVMLLLLAAVPLQSIAFMLGGITVEELLGTQLVLMVSTVAYCLVGLFYSSRFQHTLSATVLSLGTTLALLAGLPLSIIVLDSFRLAWYMPYDAELFLTVTNLAFNLNNTVSDYASFSKIAAVLGYAGIYAVASVLLFHLVVKRVRQVSQR